MVDSPSPLDAIEAELHRLLSPLLNAPAPDQPRGRGRPPILTEALLWSAVTVCILRQQATQTAVWRLLCDLGLWNQRIPITPEGVRRGLQRSDPARMEALFTQVSTALAPTLTPDRTLAPFATAVYALDASTLDAVPRVTAETRARARGDQALLPGRLSALFDLRTQQFHRVLLTNQPHENEKIPAWPITDGLEPGSLLVMDLGYFAFEWFDALTDAGIWFVTRMQKKATTQPIHRFTDTPDVRDTLVWLGVYRANRCKHRMRVIEVVVAGKRWRYLTNMTNPQQFSSREIVALYARRWTIEEAFRLLKVELGLSVLWSASWSVVQHQLWGVLLIAQVLLAIRQRIAERAGVHPDWVAMRLLVRDFPWILRDHPDDPIGFVAGTGVKPHGYLRPPRRTAVTIPEVPIVPASPDLPTIRPARYDHRVHTTAERRDQRHRAKAKQGLAPN